MPGKNRYFRSHFPGLPDVGAAALACVFAFCILAHYYPVEGAGWAIAERGGDAAEDAGRADVGVLLEGLDDGQAEAPEGEVVWYICIRA